MRPRLAIGPSQQLRVLQLQPVELNLIRVDGGEERGQLAVAFATLLQTLDKAQCGAQPDRLDAAERARVDEVDELSVLRR
jgi:hypothetical protein